MSKFGELIDLNVPVLLNFYIENNEGSMALAPILNEVAAVVGDHGKVIQIDVDKNGALVHALNVAVLPTLIIYKDGEMIWRHSGEQDLDTILSIMQKQTV